MTGRALIVQGDALHLPLPDESVDLCVTSPPYWALRSYSAGPGEIGSEPTPQAFLEALWAATAEMMRVLKPTGSIFVDLGDKYSGNETGGLSYSGGGSEAVRRKMGSQQERRTPIRTGLRPKSLLLLPERYRVGAVDRLGLIARAVIVWDKPNGLPESVVDRVRRSHEEWVHLTKGPRYYSATDEIREPHSGTASAPGTSRIGKAYQSRQNNGGGDAGNSAAMNLLGKLPGSVWTIPSEPLRLPDHLGVQHYAAFPSEWPRRLILGFSPPGICVECRTGRVPVVEREAVPLRPHHPERVGWDKAHSADGREGDRKVERATILGYACACTPHTDHPGSGSPPRDVTVKMPGTIPRASDQNNGGKQAGDYERVGPWREYHLDRWTPPPTRPAVICDPFSGVGTTVGVARQLGRIGIGVDLSHPYCRAAKWRVFDSESFGKAISRTNLERQGTLL